MTVRLLQGDCRELLKTLPDASIHCCVTSPPYYQLRDYGVEGQIGLEETVDEYVEALVEAFREVHRVLRPDGTLWLNLASTYASKRRGCTNRGFNERWHGSASVKDKQGRTDEVRPSPPGVPPGFKFKDLIPIPWIVGLALQADGWWLRADNIWAKPNPLPSSSTDRTTVAHEYVLMLAKRPRYFYDAMAIAEPCVANPSDVKKMLERRDRSGGRLKDADDPLLAASGLTNLGRKRSVGHPSHRNRRSVWTIATHPYPDAHFATFPPDIPEIAILAGTSQRGACPDCGSPYVRMIDVGEQLQTGNRRGPHANANPNRNPGEAGKELWFVRNRKTVGWEPACSCDADDPVPCVVLDPFAGAGTSGLVADRLGRDAILIDLSGEYTEMSRRRIVADAPLFAAVEVAV